MGYFRELPNVAYKSPLSHINSSGDYIFVKNIFRKTKMMDWLSTNATLFNKFQIGDGDRPDTIAEAMYGDPTLDYVVILTAGITNIRNQWPLTDNDLYDYALEKYGSEANLNAAHHYETYEIRDENQNLVIPEGSIVDDKFKIDGPGKRPNSSSAQIQWTLIKDSGNETLTQDEIGMVNALAGEITTFNSEKDNNGDEIGEYSTGPASISNSLGYPVSNLSYEILENEKKRSIDVLREGYLQLFLSNLREIMRYDRNSQYIHSSLIGSQNISIVD